MVIIGNAGRNWKEGTIMGMRFRKSFKVAPGVKINLNSSSTSVSVGSKHLRTTVNTKGQKTTSIGTPIKGVSYRKTESLNKSTPAQPFNIPEPIAKQIFKSDDPEIKKRDVKLYRFLMYFCFIICVPVILIGLVCVSQAFGKFILAMGILLLCIGFISKKNRKKLIEDMAQEIQKEQL